MFMTAETRMLRKQTEAIIGFDGVEVIMRRVELVPDGSGGYTSTEVPKPPQRVGIYTPDTQLRVRQDADGKQVSPEYELLALHDADIARGDIFLYDDANYEVVFVHRRRDKLKAEVVYRG